MSYYLEDIKTILENEGYSNVFIDNYFEPNPEDLTVESIFLMPEGGQDTYASTKGQPEFAVYVLRNTAENARAESLAIEKILREYRGAVTGSDISFKSITVTNTSRAFRNPNLFFEYLATYQANTTDSNKLVR